MSAAEGSVLDMAKEKLQGLVMWEVPVTTGLVFAVGLAGFFLVGVVGYPFLTLVAYALL